ncbi:DUF6232 family protein [Streptomyces sp. NPDC059452]|uniref:DUF6232 family protein n=1 Tax=Streptomyces sp. NPDC059452 TaxID=3346835 RepID=UPI003682687C
MPRPRDIIEVSVKCRLLWIGSAAFPLHTLARVEAVRIKPAWGTALLRLLKWMAIAIAVYAALGAMDSGDVRIGEGAVPLFIVLLFVFAIFIFKDMFDRAKPILAVETAGGTLAIVTLPNEDELRVIAGRIIHAIDHPEAEFTAYVNQLNHYNGPVFNQNGGMNTGIKL